MDRLYRWISGWHPRYVLGPALLLVFGLLAWRGHGLPASLFADEWYYSLFARLVPPAEALFPSYLYFGLFSLSSQCGPGFLDCVRLLNLLLLVATAPPVYLVARQVANRGIATVIALLAIGMPINVYGLYFMPETAYFFMFWLFTWSVLRFWRAPRPPALLLSAVLLGVTGLVKVHALFLLPPYCLFLLYAAFGRGLAPAAALRRGAGWVAAALLVFGLVRFGVGYLIAGANSLTLLGKMYSGQAEASRGLLALLPSALFSAQGHFMGLALLFAVPLAALLDYLGAGRRPAGAGAPPLRSALVVYMVLMFGMLLAVTTVFTAAVAGQNVFETNTRLHLRYYDFLLPLLLIWAAAQLEPAAGAPAPAGRRRWLIALALGALVLYGWYGLTRFYAPSGIDGPELRHLSLNRGVFAAMTLGTLATLLAWLRNSAAGARAFLLLWMPLFVLLSNFYMARDAHTAAGREDVFMRAGLALRQQMPGLDPSTLTIVANDGPGLFKTMFYMDRPQAEILMLPPHSLINARPMKRQGQWLLLLDDYLVDGPVADRVVGLGFRLVEVQPDPRTAHPIAFSDPAFGGKLRRLSGMAGSEGWGRWSDAKQVVMEFVEPLPKQGTLLLKASAYGPNVGRDFIVSIGARRYPLRLSEREEDVELNFVSDGAQHVMTIEVPQPTAPRAYQNQADDRQLGLAITNLSILSPWATHPDNQAYAMPDHGPYPLIDFSIPGYGGLLRKADGLSPAESIGSWSVAKQVVLELARPLPAAGVLQFKGLAFGPNSGRDIVVGIGDQHYTMRLGDVLQQVDLAYAGAQRQNVITLEIPQPVSPRTLHQLDDDRQLGISLRQLQVVAR